ncbi:DNA-binding protein [Candidatus Berkelbacteria bacterium CG_4_8_14_3_um_filter_33_6]|uniref:DNA-binding protein n=1 Tax=Candidatus Berkelbacteria bacterium CG_4_10_14_0_2_um_filter_35_9_33_12 TaxID=1974499 RepID=A0A2M7W4M1_9BACT|nr:MAG: DNA-binding protein [Candidatus Berkelbacteria bacterium CG23_combo_of_CG06-09_8_20_14_all_33_15]PIS08374.1 MAG: DNA-binding protein [Candidatus Berkelbacteria bacterium CG10_big_fil_rev_8_21_14_0_10_33_10]PIX31098.1 MAG: DNA-binding protein [Candidatus Berkelbacteria bacterium CG_4_8_14_3_um_filter_33_6]PIZ28376.1 MAG: DNA-binding protein [Candidatus Berkelbacteria bacterium CG_4_10_14_0_8_um_filter_35_9_33_8]PJA20286.1 MAG: DNA-binding protein [Candidatus Berkelbacteria bacterium CG_4
MSNNIAVNLKKLRKQKQITMEGLARQADVSLNTIAKIENGINKNPKIETVISLCKVLEIKIDELVR